MGGTTRAIDILPLEKATEDQLKAYDIAKEWIVDLQEADYGIEEGFFVYVSVDPQDIIIYRPYTGESVTYIVDFFLSRSIPPGMLGIRKSRFFSDMRQLLKCTPPETPEVPEIHETTPLVEWPELMRAFQQQVLARLARLEDEWNEFKAQKGLHTRAEIETLVPDFCKLCDGTRVTKDYDGKKTPCPRCT